LQGPPSILNCTQSQISARALTGISAIHFLCFPKTKRA
jgi:hypothetical protein